MKKITLLFLLLTASFSFGQVLSEDFEGGLTIPAGWTNNDIAGSGELWIIENTGEAIGFNDPNTIYYDNTIVGGYAVFDSDAAGVGPAEETALESPSFDATTISGDILLSFDHFFTAGYGGNGFVEVFDGSTWIEVAMYTGADQNDSSTGLVEIDVTTQLAAATNAQVRFRWVGDYAWGWAVDNVIVDAAPLCTVPSDFVLGALGITPTSAEIAWTDTNAPGTVFDIEYGPEGFMLGDGTVVNDVGDLSYNFTGLDPDTAYEFYITANCTAGLGDSEQVGPIAFLTAFDCTTYGVPYDENFDNANAFSCFTTEDVDGDTLSWISQQDLDLDGDLVNETFATNANGDPATLMKDDWLFSPAITLMGGVDYDVTSRFNVFGGTPNASLEAFIVDAPSSLSPPFTTLFSNTGITTQGAFETLETMAYEEVNTFQVDNDGDYYIAYRSFGAGDSGFVLLFNSSLQPTLSVNEFDSNTFTHSYNKDTDQLTLDSSGSPLSGIEMYNILGQRVINRSLSQNNEVIEMGALKDGIYLAKINIQGQTKTIKVLKQ